MFRFVFGFLSLLTSIILISVFLSPPKADAACTRAPSIFYANPEATDGIRSVTYHVIVRNNCGSRQRIEVKVSHLPNTNTTASDSVPNRSVQPRLVADWRVEGGIWSSQGNATYYTNIGANSTQRIDITVRRDIDTYHPNGSYTYVKFRAALASNTSHNDILATEYVVVNRPDLKITNFNFPSGPTCETADVKIIIRNIGWKGFGNDFVVRVNNGNGNYKDFTVTQYVSARESIDLSSRFRNRPRPYARAAAWTARAYVDRQYDVQEEDEGDNDASDDYFSRSCVTPPPPASPTPVPATPTVPPVTPPPAGNYIITGGVFEDIDPDGTAGRIDPPVENYTTGSIEIRNDITGALVYSGSSVTGSGFTSPLLPEGRYRIIFTSYQTLPAGYSVTYPVPAPFSPPAIIVSTGAGCTESPSSPINCNLGNVSDVNFGIGPGASIAEPWIHAFGGDIRYHPYLRNIIPDPYFFSEDSSVDPTITSNMTNGVVFGEELDLGGTSPEDKANKNSWLVQDEYSFPFVTTEYNYISNILREGGALRNPRSIVNEACIAGSTASNCTLINGLSGGFIYTQNSSVTLNNSGNYVFNDGNYIFLVKGNLTINHNIEVRPGSTVLFIVFGDITIGEDVTRIEGIFSTNETFEIEESSQQLIIEGTVIANALPANGGEFINGRDLGEGNESTSSIKFIFRPDFILNMPELIRYKYYIIKEVAPGSKTNN